MVNSFTVAGKPAALRPLAADDAQALLAFAQAIPLHDLLFLQRDIRKPRVIAAWLDQIASGQIASRVVVDDSGRVLACTALVRDEFSWSPHVAEVRILIAPEARGGGLGRRLAHEVMQAARAAQVKKLFVRMTPDQEGALYVFQDLGFVPEALLRDHVRDAAGQPHDIVILALDLQRQQDQQALYGLGEIQG